MLIVVAGLPGSGKSALADGLAGVLGAVVVSVRPDRERDDRRRHHRRLEAGVAAYEVAGAVAAQNLALGRTVVVDAVSDSEAARSTWWRAAAVAESAIAVVEVAVSGPDRAPPPAGESQPRLRPHRGADLDGRAAASGALRPWSVDRLVVDSTQPLDHLVDQVRKHVAASTELRGSEQVVGSVRRRSGPGGPRALAAR
jgi:thymidylate kinase